MHISVEASLNGPHPGQLLPVLSILESVLALPERAQGAQRQVLLRFAGPSAHVHPVCRRSRHVHPHGEPRCTPRSSCPCACSHTVHTHLHSAGSGLHRCAWAPHLCVHGCPTRAQRAGLSSREERAWLPAPSAPRWPQTRGQAGKTTFLAEGDRGWLPIQRKRMFRGRKMHLKSNRAPGKRASRRLQQSG